MSNDQSAGNIGNITEEIQKIKIVNKDEIKNIQNIGNIANITEETKINNTFREKISAIYDLNSKECYELIKSSIEGKISKDKDNQNYYKFIYGKWVKCSIELIIDFLTDQFNRYLIDLKVDFEAKKEDIEIIEKIMEKWKYGSIDKYKILLKIIEETYIKNNDINLIINLNNIIKENKEKEEKPLAKTQLVANIISEYFSQFVTFTGDKNDYIQSSIFFEHFSVWCVSKSYPKYDVRVIGRALKTLGVKNKHMNDGSRYMFIKFKNL